MARCVLSFRDYSREISTVSMSWPEPAAGGADYDAITDTAVTAVKAAIADVTLGQLSSEGVVVQESKEVADAGSALAQREIGLRVFYSDTTTEKKYHWTFPCADLATLAQLGTDRVDPAGTEAAALITALETYALTPDGNAVNVSDLFIVGRNS